jgi:hypothetical protein
MPQMDVRVALGASSSASAFQNQQFEYAPYDCFVEFASKGDATGVLRTVQTGDSVVQEESPVQLGTINTFPIYPDDFTLNDYVGKGERIKMNLRDTSGAARVVCCSARLTPI